MPITCYRDIVKLLHDVKVLVLCKSNNNNNNNLYLYSAISTKKPTALNESRIDCNESRIDCNEYKE